MVMHFNSGVSFYFQVVVEAVHTLHCHQSSKCLVCITFSHGFFGFRLSLLGSIKVFSGSLASQVLELSVVSHKSGIVVASKVASWLCIFSHLDRSLSKSGSLGASKCKKSKQGANMMVTVRIHWRWRDASKQGFGGLYFGGIKLCVGEGM
jgi:hypothetical protein